VRTDLDGDVEIVLDGGRCRVGVESTIVDVTSPEPVVLRVGGVSEERLRSVVGHAPARLTGGEVAAPGTLVSHYAPRAEVVLVIAAEADERAGMLRGAGRKVVVLDAPADADDHARELYARLRAADESGADVIVAVLPEDDDTLAAVVRDRLRRAAGG
jgi:L-threonylcarbamoyladenylate synthase